MSKQLITEDVARIAGLSPDSIRRYRSRGSIPEPDGYTGRTPWWHRSTIDRWLATRPHRGRPTGKAR